MQTIPSKILIFNVNLVRLFLYIYDMGKIAIISSSVRDGRLSHRVALFLEEYVAKATGIQTEIIDLKEYDFPVFHERFAFQAEPPEDVKDYVSRFNEADGVVIVTPVYNASFPAALKNVIDLLVSEWVRKPVLVVSVTAGGVPAIATIQQLNALLLKLGARVAAPMYTVINAAATFSESGVPADVADAEKRAAAPIKELLWMMGKGDGK